jgi:hypothetical protein
MLPLDIPDARPQKLCQPFPKFSFCKNFLIRPFLNDFKSFGQLNGSNVRLKTNVPPVSTTGAQ